MPRLPLPVVIGGGAMLPELGGVTTLPELGEAPPKLKDVPFVTMTAAEAAPLDSAAKTRAQVASERNMTCLPVGRPRKWGSVTGIYPGILPSDAGRRFGLVNRETTFSSNASCGWSSRRQLVQSHRTWLRHNRVPTTGNVPPSIGIERSRAGDKSCPAPRLPVLFVYPWAYCAFGARKAPNSAASSHDS